MASKRRIRRRQCSGKRRFASHDEANAAMQRLIRSGKKDGGWLHIYGCKFCKGWHFGHTSKRS